MSVQLHCPPLLTSVIGSHAHPGWFAAGIAAAGRGAYGSADPAEPLDDGVDLAIGEVARRIAAILAAGVPPQRLAVVPDCGFGQTARQLATAELHALVAGRDLVRDG